MYTDQLQGESSANTSEPSVKKRLVEKGEGKFSMDINNPISKLYFKIIVYIINNLSLEKIMFIIPYSKKLWR